MKLYQLRRNQQFRLNDKVYTFLKLDGLYVQVLDPNNNLAFINANTEVEV
jgi:hypothetical protein